MLQEEKRKAKLLKSKRPMPAQHGVERRVILENCHRVQWREKCQLSQLCVTHVLVVAVFAPDTLPVTVRQLPQTTDQDNSIPLGSHQVINADTEQCLDSMLNNFQDMCQLMELQDLEPVSSVQIKGSLKENIAFWKNIKASGLIGSQGCVRSYNIMAGDLSKL